MPAPDPPARKPTPSERRWAFVRIALGLLQMGGAVVSAYLLLATGLNDWSASAVAFTCACTTVSVLLFRGRGGPGGK